MVLLENLKLLVNLASMDGNLTENEKDYIRNIAKANGFPTSSAETLFYGHHEIVIPDKLTADQKFEYLFTLVQLMKVDERLFENEIKFCLGIVKKLGYRAEVMAELIIHISKAPMASEKKEALKKASAKFLVG